MTLVKTVKFEGRKSEMENIDEIREKAKGGDAEAQFQLGSRYY